MPPFLKLHNINWNDSLEVCPFSIGTNLNIILLLSFVLFGYFEACFEISARQMKKNNVLIFHSYSKSNYIECFSLRVRPLFISYISSIELNILFHWIILFYLPKYWKWLFATVCLFKRWFIQKKCLYFLRGKNFFPFYRFMKKETPSNLRIYKMNGFEQLLNINHSKIFIPVKRQLIANIKTTRQIYINNQNGGKTANHLKPK